MRGRQMVAAKLRVLTVATIIGMMLVVWTPPSGAAAPGTVNRITADSPADSALVVSKLRFDAGEAKWAVLARNDVYADALAGAPLTAGGPLLLVSPRRLSDSVLSELDRVLPKKTTPDSHRYVYLLGGVGEAVEDDLSRAGYTVRRLSGPSRVETAVAIARELRFQLYQNSVREVVLARAFAPENNPTAGWADAISGGAWATRMRIPLLVTPTDSVHPAVLEVIRELAPTRVVLLGGTAALSENVRRALREWRPVRVAGTDRAATAAETLTLWREDRSASLTSYLAVPGYATDGWAYGLVAAGLAADTNAPPLLVAHDDVPVPTAAVLRQHCQGGRPGVDIVGGLRAVGAEPEEHLRGIVLCPG